LRADRAWFRRYTGRRLHCGLAVWTTAGKGFRGVLPNSDLLKHGNYLRSAYGLDRRREEFSLRCRYEGCKVCLLHRGIRRRTRGLPRRRRSPFLDGMSIYLPGPKGGGHESNKSNRTATTLGLRAATGGERVDPVNKAGTSARRSGVELQEAQIPGRVLLENRNMETFACKPVGRRTSKQTAQGGNGKRVGRARSRHVGTSATLQRLGRDPRATQGIGSVADRLGIEPMQVLPGWPGEQGLHRVARVAVRTRGGLSGISTARGKKKIRCRGDINIDPAANLRRTHCRRLLGVQWALAPSRKIRGLLPRSMHAMDKVPELKHLRRGLRWARAGARADRERAPQLGMTRSTRKRPASRR